MKRIYLIIVLLFTAIAAGAQIKALSTECHRRQLYSNLDNYGTGCRLDRSSS